MRLWPGLRLVGAGGRVPKGCFVTVREVGERIVLDDGQSFTPAELLRSTRLCHAITYASCQGLTLRGRVWLCDTLNPHFSVKHLYDSTSERAAAPARSCFRSSEAIPGIPSWKKKGRGIPPRHQTLAGLARLRTPSISWRAPRCFANRREASSGVPANLTSAGG